MRRALLWLALFASVVAAIFFWRQSADLKARLDSTLAQVSAQNGALGRLAAIEGEANTLDRAFARGLNGQDAMAADFGALTTPPEQAEARAAFAARLEKLKKDLEPGAKVARDFLLSVEPPEYTLDPAKVSDEANAAFLARIDADPSWQKTGTGLRWRAVKSVAAGPQPTPESEVTVHYKGTFIDGTEFDSSYARNEPASFVLGQLIPGWVEGIPKMKEGETFEFVLPYRLAYGVAGRGSIPARQTLLFTVELQKVASNPAPPPAPQPVPAPAAPPQ